MVDIAGERRRLSDVGLTHRLRSQWGAARSYTDDRAVTEPATRLFLHITVTNPENYSSHDAHARGVEAIGIARFPNVGISYNELLMPGGLLYEAQPLTRRGAHTVNDFERSTCTTSGCPGRGTSVTAPSWNLNFNARALALTRNVDDPVIDADVRAAARWGAAVKLAGYVTRDARWHGHRCVSAKSCPGDKGWARLDDIADLTANYVRNGLPGTEWWQMPIPEQDLNAIARAVHERSVQSGSEILPLGLAVGRSTAYGKRIEEAIVGLPAAVADAVIARLPGSSADAALIRQIVAEELTKLQLTTIATSEPTPTP